MARWIRYYHTINQCDKNKSSTTNMKYSIYYKHSSDKMMYYMTSHEHILFYSEHKHYTVLNYAITYMKSWRQYDVLLHQWFHNKVWLSSQVIRLRISKCEILNSEVVFCIWCLQYSRVSVRLFWAIFSNTISFIEHPRPSKIFTEYICLCFFLNNKNGALLSRYVFHCLKTILSSWSITLSWHPRKCNCSCSMNSLTVGSNIIHIDCSATFGHELNTIYCERLWF